MSDVVPFDTLRAQLQSYQIEIDKIVAYSNSVSISSDEDAAFNVEEAGKWRKLSKRLEEKRKEILEPLREFTNQVNALVKGYTEPLEDAIRRIATKEGQYQSEKRSSIEASLAADRLLAEYLGKALQAIETPEIKATSTAHGSTYVRTDWDIEVINLMEVPCEYLTVDLAAVKRALKAGVQEISGLQITEKKINTIRSK